MVYYYVLQCMRVKEEVIINQILVNYSIKDINNRKMIEIVLLTEHSMGLLWTAIAYYALPYEDILSYLLCITPFI